MLKFLPGIILIQLITTALIFIGFITSAAPQLTVVIITFALIVSFLSAFWFASIARESHKAAETELQDKHTREREKILVNAEREKASIARESYQKIEKETSKAHAKANFKVGVACAAAMGAGGIMIFSQLVTVGMMVLVASGSGLAGYLTRARQEHLSRKKQSIDADQAILIENPAQPVKPKQLEKS